ncbi:AraC family transcriptional regulator [Paenibacillus sp. GCM10027626]|uniref:helix-turn-helix transcriptional regulator n=1 Tax=Paenibacillus sp. GCM10027626 TaxID=3273411 RepID=UPI00362AECFE
MLDHQFFSIGVNSMPAHGELSVLFSGNARPVPTHQIGPAVHNYFLVHTVVSGLGTFEINDTLYHCQAGDTFFIFPDALFTYAADKHDPWHYRWVAFKGPIALPLLNSLGISADNPVIRIKDIPTITRLYRNIQLALKRSSSAELADLESGGLLRVMLKQFGLENAGHLASQISGGITDIERQINQAIKWLSLQYAQPISIESLSRSLGYHRTHLSKMFKQATGYSPMQFLLKVRMERAGELLQHNLRLSVDHVASSVGYADALYFSKQFRKWFGYSPTEYRRLKGH